MTVLNTHYLTICKLDSYWYWAVKTIADNEIVKRSFNGSKSFDEQLTILRFNLAEIKIYYPGIKLKLTARQKVDKSLRIMI